MNHTIITGDVVLFCNDSYFKRGILQALGCEETVKNQGSRLRAPSFTTTSTPGNSSIKQGNTSNTGNSTSTTTTSNSTQIPTKNNEDKFFSVYKGQKFKVSEDFQSVMIDDKIFHKNSLHMALVNIKRDRIQQGLQIDDKDDQSKSSTPTSVNSTDKESKEYILKKIPVEAIVLSHVIHPIEQKTVDGQVSQDKPESRITKNIFTGQRTARSKKSHRYLILIFVPYLKYR
jgi:hypothetical protein